MKTRKPRLWHRLWVILLAIVLPPVASLFLFTVSSTIGFVALAVSTGIAVICFVLLWISPHNVRGKLNVTAGALAVALVAAFVSHATGVDRKVYYKLTGRDEAVYDYDVRLDRQGNYITPQILKFERVVFGAVVKNMRKANPQTTFDPLDDRPENITPERRAFEAVADEFGLDVAEVEKIYVKVSLSHQVERKK